jgi:VWFA-related protein
VSAFTVTGNHLWKHHWNECRYTPVITVSEDGSRFAASTVTLARAATPAQGDGENAHNEGLEQRVQVFDTAGGNSVLSVKAERAVLDGKVSSLSPDGRQLAVISETTLNLYSLPEMSAEERTKYLAIKADTPGLYVPRSQTGNGEAAEELIDVPATDDSADADQLSTAPGANLAVPDSAKPALAAAPATSESATGKALPAAHSMTTNLPTLTFRTGTEVVALDVVVKDSRGQLVKGLRQGDFGVTEDGKPQSLRYVREYADAQHAPQAQAPPSAAKAVLPPNIFSNYSLPVDARSVTVILFDLLNTAMSDQASAQAELVKFLKSKPRDSQFALCVLSGRLQMIQGFTKDDNVLLAAARSRKASFRHKSLLASDSAMISIEAGKATAQFRPDMEFFVQSITLQESEARTLDADRRMYVTADAFAQLARYLSGIPGRKNVVWLSGSFTLGLSPASGVPDREQNAFIQVRNFSENLRRLADLLAEAHVALYPVDVKGLTIDQLFTATTNENLSPISTQGSTVSGPIPRGGSSPGGSVANTAVPIAMMQAHADESSLTRAGEHATMDKLAAETGGHAFYNTNGIAKAINIATEEGANYYALSYTPSNKNHDGAFRKVKVSLAGGKYHLAYRSGYYAVDPHAVAKPAKDLSSGLALAAMQQGSPLSRQIVFGTRVIPLGKPRMVKDAPSTNAKPGGTSERARRRR